MCFISSPGRWISRPSPATRSASVPSSTWCCNAETCDGVPLHHYDLALADPPYSERCPALRPVSGEPEQGGGDTRCRPALGRRHAWLDQVRPIHTYMPKG